MTISVITGLEIYQTDDSNIDETSDPSSDDTSDSTIDETEGYVLQNGEITEIAYYNNIFKDSYEFDYEDISCNGSCSFPRIYKKRFYKGRKVCLKKSTSAKKWDDLESCLIGFITDQSFSNDSVDIKISGITVLLDKEEHFTFKQTKRSEILKQIIEASGLKADIDVEGLVDDVIDFSNESSSDSFSSSTSSTGSASIDEAVKNAIKGKKDDLEKAKSIDGAFKDHVIYSYYSDCQHADDLDAAWEDATLNCADGANVLCAMFISAGLDAVIVHTDGHYIVKLNIAGQTYYTDNAAADGSHTTRPFGEVWRGITSGSEVGTRLEA